MSGFSALLTQVLAARAAGQDAQSIIASQLGDDPMTALLMQAMQQKKQPDGDGDTGASDVDNLRAELQALRERSDTLAAALGACYLCWGDDPGCQVCAGRGSPGCLPINPDLFEEFIVPALRRVRARAAEQQQRTTSAERS